MRLWGKRQSPEEIARAEAMKAFTAALCSAAKTEGPSKVKEVLLSAPEYLDSAVDPETRKSIVTVLLDLRKLDVLLLLVDYGFRMVPAERLYLEQIGMEIQDKFKRVQDFTQQENQKFFEDERLVNRIAELATRNANRRVFNLSRPGKPASP